MIITKIKKERKKKLNWGFIVLSSKEELKFSSQMYRSNLKCKVCTA